LIGAALRRGEAVPMIGPAGRPAYQRWAVGAGELSDAGPSGPVLVTCSKSGMLELTPDSHTDRFRLTAEFQQDASITKDSGAGFYFAHKVGVSGPAGSAERVIVIRYEDDMINNVPQIAEGAGHGQWGNPLSLDDMLVVRTETIPFEFRPMSPAALWVKETQTKSTRPWRKVVAEVTPDAIRVYWRNPDGSMQPIRAREVRAETLNTIWNESRVPGLKKANPGIETAGLEYTPRGGVGLYLRDARVFFKNVVLEPLAP
jgi:hypothetical protein